MYTENRTGNKKKLYTYSSLTNIRVLINTITRQSDEDELLFLVGTKTENKKNGLAKYCNLHC